MTGRDGFIPPFQDLRTLAEHICVGESTIENWVRMGMFPPAKKIGGKRLWRWTDVERHLAGEAGDAAISPEQQVEDIRNAARAAAARS
jgi:hypothetical protein